MVFRRHDPRLHVDIRVRLTCAECSTEEISHLFVSHDHRVSRIRVHVVRDRSGTSPLVLLGASAPPASFFVIRFWAYHSVVDLGGRWYQMRVESAY